MLQLWPFKINKCSRITTEFALVFQDNGTATEELEAGILNVKISYRIKVAVPTMTYLNA